MLTTLFLLLLLGLYALIHGMTAGISVGLEYSRNTLAKVFKKS